MYIVHCNWLSAGKKKKKKKVKNEVAPPSGRPTTNLSIEIRSLYTFLSAKMYLLVFVYSLLLN